MDKPIEPMAARTGASARFQFGLKSFLSFVAVCVVVCAIAFPRTPVPLTAQDIGRLPQLRGRRVTVHGLVAEDPARKGLLALMIDGGGPIHVDPLPEGVFYERVVVTGTLDGTGIRNAQVRIERPDERPTAPTP